MRILVVASRLPGQEQSGASMRLMGLLGLLAQRHSISLACPVPEDEKVLSSTVNSLPFEKIVPLPQFTVKWPLEHLSHRVLSSGMSRLHLHKLRDWLLLDPSRGLAWIAPIESAVRDVLSSCIREHQYEVIVAESEALINLALVRWPADVTLILNSQNVLSSQMASDKDMGGLTLWEQLWLLKVKFYYESWVCRRFDHIVAVSPEDKHRWARRLPGKSIGVVPNGVDTNYFCSHATDGDESCDIAFIGGANYPPNQLAMIELTNEIFPRVQSVIPEVSLTLIGKDPPIDHLSSQTNVRIVGYVQDLRPLLARSSVFVAPIRQGGGTRIKVLTAMSMGKAVVTTPMGAEGLDVNHNHDIVLAESRDELAHATIDLLQDSGRRRTIGLNARASVLKKYEWARLAEIFEDQMVDTAERKRRKKCRSELNKETP